LLLELAWMGRICAVDGDANRRGFGPRARFRLASRLVRRHSPAPAQRDAGSKLINRGPLRLQCSERRDM